MSCSFAGPITIVYGEGYAPFAFSENDNAVGIQKDFVEEILVKRLKLNVKHEICPWRRCQSLVKDGRRDGFFTVSTPERLKYTDKNTVPFYQTSFLLHTQKNNPFLESLKNIKSLKELKSIESLKHVHMLGSGWHEHNLKGFKNITTLKDTQDIPLFLSKGRADIYIEQDKVFKYQLAAQGLQNKLVTLNDPVIEKLGWHLFIGKHSKHRDIIQKVDTLLLSLRDSGELEKIKEKIFSKYE